MTNKKREKVLHARVSEDLFDKISTKARKHRVSVSNLVRNLMEDYLEIHEEVWDAVDNKIRKHIAQSNDFIVGYQTINLNKDTACAFCREKLNKGTQAFVGFYEKSPQKIIICQKCQEENKI